MRPWILFLACCAAFGQQKLAFEVASIKPSQPMGMGRMRVGIQTDESMMRSTNVSLKEYIRIAYRVKDFQVQGPDWLDSTRFDIVAKIPEGASKDQVPEMLEALLAERFKLALHRDKKEHAIYALVAAKGGPKLKPAEVPAGEGRAPRGNMQIMMGPGGAHVKTPSATLAQFAETISRFAERPVVDMSGIEGQYDFDLVFTPETRRNMPGAMRGPMGPPPGGGEPAPAETPAERAGSIYDAVQSYGLKLEPRKAPMEVLVVDRIERTPTEN